MLAVMFEGVLTGEREPFGPHTTLLKDFAIMVESVEGRVESVERLFSQNVFAGDVAEVEECVEGLDDTGDKPQFSWSEHLGNIARKCTMY